MILLIYIFKTFNRYFSYQKLQQAIHIHVYTGFPFFTDKNIQDISRDFQTPIRNFPGPFRSPRMLKYKEKHQRRRDPAEIEFGAF